MYFNYSNLVYFTKFMAQLHIAVKELENVWKIRSLIKNVL